MPDIYHLDYETRSRCDLRACGAYRYAEDPSTRILMFAIARNDEKPVLWLNPELFPAGPNYEETDRARDLLHEALLDPDALIYAHNAPFEIAVSKYRMESDIELLPPALHKWRCTAALARRAGLRASLANLGEDLGLKQLKFGEGYQLIRLFSIPQKDGQFVEPSSQPEKFKRFGEYCVQDVESEREAHHRLKPFELRGALLDAFLFDLRMNDRGLPLNVQALRHAQRIIDEVQTRVAKEFTELTGLNPTQRDKVKDLLETVYGVKLVNMQGATIDKALAYHEEPEEEEWDAEQEPDDVRAKRILHLYRQLRFAAVKKVRTMLDCVCSDGFARGMFLWYGAGTGRHSGQKIQPQNFRRPTIKDADEAYAMICNGCSAEDLELVYGNPLEAIANCIRNFIHDLTGPMFDADYSAIEARITAWVSNEEWRMKVFRTHGKIYEASACAMFGLRMEQVTGPIRQKSKVAELALGYQGASGALRKMGALDMGLKESDLQPLVDAWRDANPNIVKTWYALERCAKAAILNPGTTHATNKAKLRVTKLAGIPYLCMELPSGRNIVYPHPEYTEDDGITYYGALLSSSKWGRVKTYGGSLMNNLVQGIAADLMWNGEVNAENAGFALWGVIHDQGLAKAQPGRLKDFHDALTRLPSWAAGLPLKADAVEAPYYRK